MDEGPATANRFLIRNRLWILLALTGIAGAVRFATLTRPPIWGDEAFTYYRTSGDFQDLFNILQFNGFPPLHYEAYWALGQAHKLTPAVMRVIPAMAGTLMVPAMYFLAAQLLRTRVALLVALFTCCSAYTMVYSHDAKMYMACWLFVTLHIGCLLWWLRISRATLGRVAWLSWIATGIAAAGMHHSANLVLPIEAVVLFTFPRGPLSISIGRRISLFVIGLLIVLSGPAGYFIGFNRIAEKVDEQGFSSGSETFWVDTYNLGRTPTDLVLYTATAHLYSWEWPQDAEKRAIDHDLLHGLMAVGVSFLVLIAAGAMPWSRSYQALETTNPTWWRLYLWLGTWIVAIGYGIYCASVNHFNSPREILRAAGGPFAGRWLAVGIEVVVLASISHARPAFAKYLAASVPIVALLSLYFPFVRSAIDKPWLGQQWQANYWPALTGWWRWVTASNFLIVLVAILPVVAWQFSADRPAERFKTLGLFLAVTAIILLACGGVWWGFHHRFHSLVSKMQVERHLDAKSAEQAVWSSWLSVWMPRYLGIVWPAVAISACTLLCRLPTRPLRYAAIALLLGVNVAQATARLVAGTEPPSDLIAADVVASQDKVGGTQARTYLLNMGGLTIGAPGSQSIYSPQTRYYFSQATTRPVKPHDFKFTPPSAAATFDVWGLRLWTDFRADTIAADARTPSLRRLVIWEKLSRPNQSNISVDLSRKLGYDWKITHVNRFQGRDHWTWTDFAELRRYEFERE